jgi:hypothetical protein
MGSSLLFCEKGIGWGFVTPLMEVVPMGMELPILQLKHRLLMDAPLVGILAPATLAMTPSSITWITQVSVFFYLFSYT